MAGGGYTPAEISAFYLSDIDAIYARWERVPPVAELVAAYMGYKPPPKAVAWGGAAGGNVVNSVAALRAAFPDGLMRG